MRTRLSRSAAMLGILSAPAHSQAPAGPQLNAKVQETLMGPASPRVVLSPDGDHLAIVAAKGSRSVVLLDGVEGPVFDDIPMNFVWSTNRYSTGSMAFSPTGGHSAYVGRRGGDFIAVVDGKEAVTLSTPAALQGPNYGVTNGWGFFFNRDGSRLAYGAMPGPGTWVMVVDGVKSPPYRAVDFMQTALKGKRLVYVAQTADQLWHAVVDGKQGPGFTGINSLQVTPDGLHYAFLAFPMGSQNQVAVVDGVVEGRAYRGVADLELAPDGRVAYVAAKTVAPGAAHGGGTAVLVVAGKEQPGSCGAGPSPVCLMFNTHVGGMSTVGRHVSWSPDGKGFAYVQSNAPNPGVTVIVSGKPMGPTYNTATQPMWNIDGSRFAYLGSSPNGFFQVIDGDEFPAVHDLPEFQWSPDGKRYTFQGKGAGSATAASVIVDGKPQPQPKGAIIRESFRWSPDSKHFAYGALVTVSDYGPYLDGQAKPVYLGQFMAMTYAQPPIIFPPLLFSPDGSRLAHVGRTYDATGRANSKDAVYVDGVRYEGPGQSYQFPSFSPDGKHFATVTTTGQGSTVMIDGKVGPSYESLVLGLVSAARFVGPSTYRFYGIKGGQIYRVTLDLGA